MYVPAGSEVPPLDPRDRQPCADPGVDRDARRAAVENRLAWAECRKKHDNVVAQYESVREAAQEETARE